MKDDHTYGKKWPGMVVQRTFIKGHSFVYRLYDSKQCFVKFIYSEKATKFCKILPLLLTVSTVVKKGKISQNFAAFSEYMNFKAETLIFKNCVETLLVQCEILISEKSLPVITKVVFFEHSAVGLNLI